MKLIEVNHHDLYPVLNYLYTKVLSLHCVLGKLNSVYV
jgi:hypothetical protein